MSEKEEEESASFDELIQQALNNAIEDRARAVDAFEKTKNIYDINLNGEDSETSNLQGLMLIGQNVSKLLEISLKSNDQIIKLAQLKKGKKNETSPEEEKEEKPYDIDEINKLSLQ